MLSVSICEESLGYGSAATNRYTAPSYSRGDTYLVIQLTNADKNAEIYHYLRRFDMNVGFKMMPNDLKHQFQTLSPMHLL